MNLSNRPLIWNLALKTEISKRWKKKMYDDLFFAPLVITYILYSTLSIYETGL